MVAIRWAEDRADLARCYPVMKELRTHLAGEAAFAEQVERQARAYGYRVCFLEADGQVACVGGVRISECLCDGRFLYVDDLVTGTALRSRGYGAQLLDWIVAYARANGCREVGLESGVQRFGAHRFYFARRMKISSYHFSLKLE
ncbi:MAG: GNAT family N-acetyltransferase [Planctomycetes bacterium]|nr:GNAT family N-acetyltransferase [Planctomycetota bacterium]